MRWRRSYKTDVGRRGIIISELQSARRLCQFEKSAKLFPTAVKHSSLTVPTP